MSDVLQGLFRKERSKRTNAACNTPLIITEFHSFRCDKKSNFFTKFVLKRQNLTLFLTKEANHFLFS